MKTNILYLQKKRNAAKLLSLVVAVSGIFVIFGWIYDIPVLKSIRPDWITMKFAAALCFILSGITLYFITRAQEGEFDKSQVVLSITALIMILFMGTFFFSSLIGVHTGVEDLFVREGEGGIKTVVPGRPSVPTMINFLLVALASILTMLNSDSIRPKLRIIGLIIGIIGASALLGYIFNAPVLYYYIEGVNSAIACNTAALFVLLGIGFVCL